MVYMPTRGLRGAYASLRGGTKTNPQKPSTIFSYKFVCITSCQMHILPQLYMHVYARICIDKLVDNLHIPSHLKNANEHLPTQLCLRNKNLHCFRGCLRTPPRTVKYQVVSLRDFVRSSLEYIMPCIQQKTMLKSIQQSIPQKRLCGIYVYIGEGAKHSQTHHTTSLAKYSFMPRTCCWCPVAVSVLEAISMFITTTYLKKKQLSTTNQRKQ